MIIKNKVIAAVNWRIKKFYFSKEINHFLKAKISYFLRSYQLFEREKNREENKWVWSWNLDYRMRNKCTFEISWKNIHIFLYTDNQW